MKTTEECGYVYEKAKELMDEREKDYEGSWKEEGLACMVASLYKKASQIRVMLENGRLKENRTRAKEDMLDIINYGVLSYRLIELGEKEK